MDELLKVLQRLVGSDTAILAVSIIGILWYKDQIKPSLEKKNEYETTLMEKTKILLTKDDLISLKIGNTEEIVEKIADKIKDLLEDYQQDIKEAKIKSEEIKAILKGPLKDDIQKIKSILESMQLNISEHDVRVDFSERIIEDVKETLSIIYSLVDKILSQLETKGLVDKIDRVDFNKSNISSKDIMNILDMMGRIAPRERKRDSKLSRLTRSSRDFSGEEDYE
jgi:hypothetical protein